jgi:hypothetical protein
MNDDAAQTLAVLADEKSRDILGIGRISIESDGRSQPPAEVEIVPLPGQVLYEIEVPDEIYAIPSIAELERMYELEVAEAGRAQFRKRGRAQS